MKGWKKGDDLGLVRYTSPPKERGTAYLRNGGSTWLFLPSAEKVVRVGAKQNFGGGDFSNGDIFRLSLTKDYVATLAGEETVDGQACWKLELKAQGPLGRLRPRRLLGAHATARSSRCARSTTRSPAGG